MKRLTAVTAAAMIAVTATASSFTALAGDPIELPRVPISVADTLPSRIDLRIHRHLADNKT